MNKEKEVGNQFWVDHCFGSCIVSLKSEFYIAHENNHSECAQ